jgi:hypothetical protein
MPNCRTAEKYLKPAWLSQTVFRNTPNFLRNSPNFCGTVCGTNKIAQKKSPFFGDFYYTKYYIFLNNLSVFVQPAQKAYIEMNPMTKSKYPKTEIKSVKSEFSFLFTLFSKFVNNLTSKYWQKVNQKYPQNKIKNIFIIINPP